MWKKKSTGSRYLRAIVSKLNAVDNTVQPLHWGNPFTGEECPPLTPREEKLRSQILDQSMPQKTAERIHDSLDTATPFYERVEIIEAIASLSALHGQEMHRKVTGANKPLHDLLWSASIADHIWLWMTMSFNSNRFEISIDSSGLPLYDVHSI